MCISYPNFAVLSIYCRRYTHHNTFFILDESVKWRVLRSTPPLLKRTSNLHKFNARQTKHNIYMAIIHITSFASHDYISFFSQSQCLNRRLSFLPIHWSVFFCLFNKRYCGGFASADYEIILIYCWKGWFWVDFVCIVPATRKAF